MQQGLDHSNTTSSTTILRSACRSNDPATSIAPPETASSPGRQEEHSPDQLRHKQYLDRLRVPSLASTERIAKVQELKEEKVERKYASLTIPEEEDVATSTEQLSNTAEREEAAGRIQRLYRGHRERRQLNGLSLDPSSRWTEAIREARYRNLTKPRPRTTSDSNTAENGDDIRHRSKSDARAHWQQISRIARHAHGEEEGVHSSSSSESSKQNMTTRERAAHAHHKRQERREKDAWKGKMMDLPYFLEMVDLKHRYGSNLRAYHAEWKAADTHENFFYWLDYGQGREVEIPKVSRERLEREQVRYLSREERLQYLVQFDKEGRLRWWKNGQLIDTNEEYRDSVEGIVAQDDKTKKYREDEIAELEQRYRNEPAPSPVVPTRSGSHSSMSSGISSSSEASARYPDPSEMRDAKGPTKITHVTPAFILNRLLRNSVKKNTWIYVADTRMNLYVGIKQSGAFQHSSFMHGSRISAAGQIKIKRGQLRSLSPLSGHYRPPTSAFRHFIQHLKEQNVDVSRVSVSKSYAVLVGLETYMGAKKKTKHVGDEIKEGARWVVHPDQARERREKEKDKSKSAQIAAARQREMEEQMSPFGTKFKVLGAKVGDKWADRASRPGTSASKTGSLTGRRVASDGQKELTPPPDQEYAVKRDQQAEDANTPPGPALSTISSKNGEVETPTTLPETAKTGGGE